MVRKDANEKKPKKEKDEDNNGDDSNGKDKSKKGKVPAKKPVDNTLLYVMTALCAMVFFGCVGFIVMENSDAFGDETLCFDHEKTDCMLRSQYRIYVSNWEKAVEFQQEDRIEEAMDSYAKALEVRPTDANSLANIASMYIDLEDFDSAKTELDKALAAHPNHISCLHNMASVHEFKKEPEKSKEYLERILAIDPDNKNAKSYMNLLKGGDTTTDLADATAVAEAVSGGESSTLDSLLD